VAVSDASARRGTSMSTADHRGHATTRAQLETEAEVEPRGPVRCCS
jgi:hypothetical protein